MTERRREEERGYSSTVCCGDLLTQMLSQMSAQYSSAVGCFPVVNRKDERMSRENSGGGRRVKGSERVKEDKQQYLFSSYLPSAAQYLGPPSHSLLRHYHSELLKRNRKNMKKEEKKRRSCDHTQNND